MVAGGELLDRRHETHEAAAGKGEDTAFLAAAALTSRPALAAARVRMEDVVVVDDDLMLDEEAVFVLAKMEAEGLEKVSVDIDMLELAVLKVVVRLATVRRASVERALRGIIMVVFFASLACLLMCWAVDGAKCEK